MQKDGMEDSSIAQTTSGKLVQVFAYGRCRQMKTKKLRFHDSTRLTMSHLNSRARADSVFNILKLTRYHGH